MRATRNTGLEFGKPIAIGDDVWLGGNVVVLPGGHHRCGYRCGGWICSEEGPSASCAGRGQPLSSASADY